jgi:predicted RNase H-like nuclease (RuvC/YqgF family)
MGIDENINIGRELQERIAELEAENSVLKRRIEWFQETFEVDIFNRSALVERLKTDLAATAQSCKNALDEIQRLRQDLQKYGNHKPIRSCEPTGGGGGWWF